MAERSEQIVREAPEIEAEKLFLIRQARWLASGLDVNKFQDYQNAVSKFGATSPEAQAVLDTAKLPASQTLAARLPGYQVAGFAQPQQTAMQAAEAQGIGAFMPYIAAANQAIGQGYGTTAEAADVLRGADTRQQFTDAQRAMQQAGLATAGVTSGMPQIGAGYQLLDAAAQRALASDVSGRLGTAYSGLGAGLGSLGTAQQLAGASAQADLYPAMQQLGAGSQLVGAGAQQAMGAGGMYDPRSALSFMNPYQQGVTQQALQEMRRQGDIARQQQSAQAVRAGAFGGTREGVQRAEMERGLQDVMSQRIFQDYAQNFAQAQQASMGAQEAARQRQLGIGAALTGAGAQQAGIGQTLGQLGLSQAGLGQQAAGLYSQTAGQFGQLAGQQAGIAAQESAIQQSIANALAQQAGQRGALAGQQAGIYGQQAGLMQNLGQGIGALAGQQYGIGQSMASGLGALGGQLGQLGIQQAALGQTAQALQQGDINFLYNIGQSQQALNQQVLDAQRATATQQLYAPYQQAAFLSDIQKGAPSTQMATAAASSAQPSPFQQVVGTGLGALATAAGVQKLF